MEIIKKIIVSLLCILILGSCKHDSKNIPQNTSPQDNVTHLINDAVLDSLGELAYDKFEAYEKDPENFLSKIENKELTRTQQDTYLWILINMAFGYQEHNQILQSATYYEKALLYDNEHNLLEKSDRLNYIYKPLANNYTILSDYGKGERLQLSALEEAPDNLTKASFYNNLALLYSYKGEEEKSKQFGIQGLKYCKESPYLCVMLHNSLSNSFILLGKNDSARWHTQRALQQISHSNLESPQLKAAAIVTNSQLAAFLFQDGKHQEAESKLLLALQQETDFFPSSRYREKASLYNKLGVQALANQSTDQAKHYLYQGLALYEKENERSQSSTYTKVNLLKNLALTYTEAEPDSSWLYFRKAVEADFAYQQGVTTKESHLRNNYWNRELLEEVFKFAESRTIDQEELISLYWMMELTKARLLWNDISRSGFWSNQSGLNEVTIQLQSLYAQRDRLSDSLEIKNLNQQIMSLLADFELEEKYFSMDVQLPEFEDFKNGLSHEQALSYSYFIHTDQSISIFKNDQGRLSYWHQAIPGLLDSLSHFKNVYFTSNPHYFNDNPTKYFESADYLRQVLLPDLNQDHSGKSQRNLKLSLDNELFTIPFDALSMDGIFLIKNYNVQYIHSMLTSSLYPIREFTNQPIHILYREKYDPPMPDLKFVAKEVRNIDSRFKTELFPPKQLSIEKLKQAFDHQGIIHIAAHATLNENLEASLLLENPISTDQLRYYHMNSPLVVLSACNTATGQILLSEGMESINRTFLSKGVNGVIANHWFANDDSMLDLTSKFYKNLSQIKKPVEALAEAKRQYLNEQSALGSNPWYWANMAYMGEDIKIDLQKNTGLFSLPSGYLIMAAFMILLLIVLSIRLL